MSSITSTAKATKNARPAGATTTRTSRDLGPHLDLPESTQAVSEKTTAILQCLTQRLQSQKCKNQANRAVVLEFNHHPKPYNPEELAAASLTHPANLGNVLVHLRATSALVSAPAKTRSKMRYYFHTKNQLAQFYRFSKATGWQYWNPGLKRWVESALNHPRTFSERGLDDLKPVTLAKLKKRGLKCV